jgi:5-methylcytosine-specific restriction endonuclease McrA
MKCKKCNQEVEILTPSGFCSRSCANKRTHSEETKKKIAASSGGTLESSKLKSIANKVKWADPEYRGRVTQAKIKQAEAVGWDNLKWGGKRNWVLRDQSGACARCGANEWLGEPLSLEVDHIDGDHKNELRENLIALCPNCHSITPTWRGKKKALQVS